MWTLAAGIFLALKWLTWRQTRRGSVPVWKQIAYLFAWPGMDAAAFFIPAKTPAAGCTAGPASPGALEWLSALSKTTIGIAIGTISLTAAPEIAARGPLARGFCAYVLVFWLVRLALQFVFDVKAHLITWWLRLGYRLLTFLFAALAVIYGWAAVGPAGR